MAEHVRFTKNRVDDGEIILDKQITTQVKKSKQLRQLNDEKDDTLRTIDRLNTEVIELDRRITQITGIR